MRSHSKDKGNTPSPAEKNLSAYRAKRNPQRTPEPFGTNGRRLGQDNAPSADDPGRLAFVVQLHNARRQHFDLRLEWAGVLKSWAVPKGISDDPTDKRMAVQTEDHPIDYGAFEGVIPAGEYGAGDMVIWDRGTYVPLIPMDDALRDGKLLFELTGSRLQGVWTLFRAKNTQWILMKKPLHASNEQLMLAKGAVPAFSDPAFVFELKYDGYRMLAEKLGGHVRLLYRGGGDVTSKYPEIATAVHRLKVDHAIIDGEMVAFDAEGVPRFSLLQQRASGRSKDALTLMAFDLLALGGADLRSLPLRERKARLQKILPRSHALRFADHVDEQGEALFHKVANAGLEGVMAKRADSPYKAGRHADWLKVPARRTGDFAVIGFAPPQGTRQGFAGLHIAAREGAAYVYAGRVGTGFQDEELRALRTRLDALRTDKPVCIVPKEDRAGSVWVRPQIIIEVRFLETSKEGRLRQPVYLRERADKQTPHVDPALVKVSNPNKVFFPDLSLTKTHLVDYYRAIAPFALPYLKDRPVVLTRYPDGIEGKSFFQKDAPEFAPSWLRTLRIYSESTQRDIDHFILESADALAYVANLGAIPLHVWASRAASLEHPDWLVIDIDPKQAPFEHVIAIAKAVKSLCDDVGLPSYAKTTGSSGLHVCVPLGGVCTYAQAKALAELLCRVIVRARPDISTIERDPKKRQGKVYLDFLQNGHGKTIAAAFCVRPVPEAAVSMPLRWSEVNAKLSPRKFTVANALDHVRKWKVDPWEGLLTDQPDLLGALQRLQSLMAKRKKKTRVPE